MHKSSYSQSSTPRITHGITPGIICGIITRCMSGPYCSTFNIIHSMIFMRMEMCVCVLLVADPLEARYLAAGEVRDMEPAGLI